MFLFNFIEESIFGLSSKKRFTREKKRSVFMCVSEVHDQRYQTSVPEKKEFGMSILNANN